MTRTEISIFHEHTGDFHPPSGRLQKNVKFKLFFQLTPQNDNMNTQQGEGEEDSSIYKEYPTMICLIKITARRAIRINLNIFMFESRVEASFQIKNHRLFH